MEYPIKIDAIVALKSDVKVTINGDNIIWYDDSGNEVSESPDGITEKQIDDKYAELLAEYNTEYTAQEYARKRKAEYPTIEELVVALYDTDDKSAIEAKRAEVKAKYPK